MTIAVPSLRAVVCAPGWVRNDLWRRARAVPSLDLRFADSKSLVDAVTGQNLITFTRASSGTFVDSAGVLQTAAAGVPRFDHNPMTLESLGLLVEEQRTNLLLRSEEFETTWSQVNTTVSANTSTSPAGNSTADIITPAASTSAHLVAQAVTVQASRQYIASVYVKSDGAPFVQVVYDNGNSIGAFLNINTSTGAITRGPELAGGASNVVGGVVPVSNGWYRLFIGATHTGTIGRILVSTLPADGATTSVNATTTTTTNDRIAIWGAQLEAGAFPTSYIPTTGSAATRNADVADIINAAIANGIRTLYSEFRSPASGARGVVSLNDNTANERAAINSSGTDPRLVVVDGGVTQADIDAGTIVANARSRMAVRIAADNFAASFNGGAIVTDTSGTLPTVDRLFIGRSQAGEYLNAPIARLIGWREALPDSVLQALTQ